MTRAERMMRSSFTRRSALSERRLPAWASTTTSYGTVEATSTAAKPRR